MSSQSLPESPSDRAGPARRLAAPTGVRTWLWPAILGLGAALAAWGYLALGRESPGPDVVWDEAQADLKLGRPDRVADAVARLARLREPNAADRMLRGQLEVARGRPDEALAELARVPNDHPMAANARALAGQVELRRHRFRAAEEALRAALRLDPKLIQAHRDLVYIYGFQLRRAELGGEFRALSELTELQFDALLHWGLLNTESWEPSGVAKELARCIAADPGDRWSRLALADNQRRMGLWDQAVATLTPLAPDDIEAIAARVWLALDRGDEAAAARLLESGPPAEPILALPRGRLAMSRRDVAAALHHFRVAHEAQPDSHEAIAGLIAALRIRGDAQAIAPLSVIAARLERLGSLLQYAASKKGRDDPELPLLLGEAWAALHRDAEARGWYRLAIARDPLDSRAQRALFHLGAVGRKPIEPEPVPRP